MGKHKEHICRFNDGDCTCECYDAGFEEGKKQKGYSKKDIVKAIKETFKICDDVVMGVSIQRKGSEGDWQNKLVKDFMDNLEEIK